MRAPRHPNVGISITQVLRLCASAKRTKRDLAYTAADRRILRAAEIRKDEVRRAQRLREPKGIDRPPTRYPIALHLHYKAKSKTEPVHGIGQTITMSNRDIVFAMGEGLKPRMNAEIVLDWPRLRDGWIQLQLALGVRITGNQDGVVEAQIVTYAFRTREPTEAGRKS